eukprot:435172_1
MRSICWLPTVVSIGTPNSSLSIYLILVCLYLSSGSFPEEPFLNNWTAQHPCHFNLGGSTVFKPYDSRSVTRLYKSKSPELILEVIQSLYFMPMSDAAKLLNISPTVFKRACRKLGVNYWPHRQLVPLQRRIEHIRQRLQNPHIYGISKADYHVIENELRQLVHDTNDVVLSTNWGLRPVLKNRMR